ncbi:unnamed protein product [Danaus chrysippus]|uniref:(African queen) hypothetical protein n=1 Tax=Danaus chrysippus TaxID=151541 RepID=A0A8J2R7G0_9NEOP|nr:unnamed protein product [Danaus chrysippus]
MFVRAYDRELVCLSSHRALQQAAGRTPAARRLARKRSYRRRDELSKRVPFHAVVLVVIDINIERYLLLGNVFGRAIWYFIFEYRGEFRMP